MITDVDTGNCNYIAPNPTALRRWGPTVEILSLDSQRALVPDTYIGVVSSSMFAGMMIGAVGWGTCESTLILISNIILLIFLLRLRPHGTKYSLQRDPLFHCPLWSPCIFLKFFLYSLHCALLLGNFSRGGCISNSGNSVC